MIGQCIISERFFCSARAQKNAMIAVEVIKENIGALMKLRKGSESRRARNPQQETLCLVPNQG